MRILFTGGRAPATLELVRNFGSCGWEVYIAESIEHHLSEYSRYAKEVYKVNPPRFADEAFIDDLIHIINNNEINVLFPTCEEIFWISKHKRRIAASCSVKIICDDMDKLTLLHNKYRMIELAKSENITVPETRIFCDEDKFVRKSVIKPVFSRFGEDVVVIDKQEQIDKFNCGDRQYIIQEFIEGEPVCSYGYAENGVLKFNICYKSPFRAKTFTVFEPFECDKINRAVAAIVKRLNFSGNISFDFIRRGEQCFLIECNPRITSGIHTLGVNPFDRLFFGEPDSLVMKKAQLLLPTLIGFRFVPYSDAIGKKNDMKPFFKQAKCLLTFWAIAKKHDISLTKAMTYDIEWNGDEAYINI